VWVPAAIAAALTAVVRVFREVLADAVAVVAS